MSIEHWRPSRSYTRQEEALLRRLRRTRKLFAFLRDHREELFDDAFQQELDEMYRDTGAGRDPVPPALLAMASVLQGYLGASDAEAVELTVVDLRWQMVLDRLGCNGPAFSQGALYEFRQWLIEHSLAHLGRRQGRRARYRGTRKNLYDVRRAANVQNLETIQRRLDDGRYVVDRRGGNDGSRRVDRDVSRPRVGNQAAPDGLAVGVELANERAPLHPRMGVGNVFRPLADQQRTRSGVSR